MYVDTCVIIELSECETLFNTFKKYLDSNELKILVTDPLCHELSSKKQHIHDNAQTVLNLPHTLAIPSDKILDYEIKSYPNKLTRSIEYDEIKDQDVVIRGLFTYDIWNKTREQYEKDRKQALVQIKKFKTGSWENSWQVATLWILNDIKKIDYELFTKIQKDYSMLDIEAIPSEWIKANIAYEKYILEDIEPSLTDLGDFLHIPYIPYCGLAIVENEMCRLLNKIKRETKYQQMRHIEFRNLKFIRNLII